MTGPLQVGESWIGDTADKWSAIQRVDPSRIVFDEDSLGRPEIRMTVVDGDVLPGMPNNRAQLVRADLYVEGGVYLSSGGRRTIDECSASGWFEGDQFAYGKPQAGSPSWRTMTLDGKNYGLRYEDAPMIWTYPIVLGEAWNYASLMTVSRSKAPFLFGAWRDGEAPFHNRVIRQDPTIVASMSIGPWGFYLDAYMAAGTATRIVVRHSPPTITRIA